MTSDMWIDDYERIGEEYASGAIDRDEAESRLKRLGFDQAEIDDHIAAIDS